MHWVLDQPQALAGRPRQHRSHSDKWGKAPCRTSHRTPGCTTAARAKAACGTRPGRHRAATRHPGRRRTARGRRRTRRHRTPSSRGGGRGDAARTGGRTPHPRRKRYPAPARRGHAPGLRDAGLGARLPGPVRPARTGRRAPPGAERKHRHRRGRHDGRQCAHHAGPVPPHQPRRRDRSAAPLRRRVSGRHAARQCHAVPRRPPRRRPRAAPAGDARGAPPPAPDGAVRPATSRATAASPT